MANCRKQKFGPNKGGVKYRILKCAGLANSHKTHAKIAPGKTLFGSALNYKPFGNPLG
jgi:hypothetical protein